MDGAGASSNMDGAGTSNMSMEMEEPDFMSTFSQGTDIVIGLYITTISLLTVGTNLAVLWGMFKKKRNMTDMDIVTINISICQIAPAFFSYPMILISAFLHRWNFPEVDCKWDGFFIYFFAMTTIGSLLLMTVYRYFRMFYGHLFSKQNALRVRLSVFVGLGVCYLYGLLWALPPLLGYGSYILEFHHLACSVDWTSLPLPYILGILLLGYFLPICTMAGTYGRIVATVRFSSQKLSTGTKGAFRRDYHVTIVAILHCVCFLLVWTPYAVLSFMTIFSLPVPSSFYVTSGFFAKVDTLINPFIFFVINNRVSNSSTMHKLRQHFMEKKQTRVHWKEDLMPQIQESSIAGYQVSKTAGQILKQLGRL